MNYAAYVEAKGYNVILPAELKAKSELPAEINKLVMKANKAIELFRERSMITTEEIATKVYAMLQASEVKTSFRV